MSANNRAQEIFNAAFRPGREPRSEAYQKGVLFFLKNSMEGQKLSCPFKAGTAERDAYLAGCEEGRTLQRMAARGDMAA